MLKLIPKLQFILFLHLLVLSLASCKKLVSVSAPINQLGSSIVFTNDASAVSAISGLYSSISLNGTSFAGSGTSIFCGLSAAELHNSTSTTYDDFFNNSLTSGTTALASNIWTPAYNYIYQANAILEGLVNGTGVGTATANQIKGEALFIRAFCYFYLTNYFGDVPLVLSTDYRATAYLPRSSSKLVYQQIVSDLTTAQQLLKVAYPSANKGRLNLYAATALLARVYLFQKDWANAIAQSTIIIGSNTYALTANLSDVFLVNSKEAIWQLIPVPATSNTLEGTNFIPSGNTVPNYELTTHLLNAFTSGDKRKTQWTNTVTINNIVYTYPYKYKVKTGANVAVTEYYMMLRFAEQYLIRAEARARQGNLTEAIKDIDMIRHRAGLTLIAKTNPNISQKDLIAAILEEKRKEFFAERGHRWLDLKRSGNIDAVLAPIKTNWKAIYALYPIPQAQILINYNLTQNPGYQ